MNNLLNTESNLVVTSSQESSATLGNTVSVNETSNPVLERALRRLKESQVSDKHVAYYTKHGSHSTHSKSSW